MRISTVAFANLKRRKGKALFLIVGISIGIGTVVALLSLSGSIKEEIISGQNPEGEQDVLVGYEVARALSIIEPAAGATPQAVSHGGSHQPSEDQSQFKVTRDRLQIAGNEHHIAGVINQTGSPDDRIIFGNLAHVQSLVNKPDHLSVIEVSALCKDCPIDDIVGQISERLPNAKVSAIQQAVRARSETVGRLTRFSAVVSAVVLAIGALMIFTTMMGSVVERTKEIGVLRAIGFRKVRIVKGLMIEVVAVSFAGGIVGWAAGLLASWAALPYFSPLY